MGYNNKAKEWAFNAGYEVGMDLLTVPLTEDIFMSWGIRQWWLGGVYKALSIARVPNSKLDYDGSIEELEVKIPKAKEFRLEYERGLKRAFNQKSNQE